MEIKLDNKTTFEIEYKQDDKVATFTFNHNRRSLYILATEGFSREGLTKRVKADLVKIEGLQANGKDVKVDDFEALPIEIYAHVVNEYSERIAKKITEASSEKKN